MAANDGWYDLPSGGKIHLRSGVPVEVSDAGRWDLDERQILAEAAHFVDMPLLWAELDRSKRWHHTGLVSLFKQSNEWRWCVARVLREACELCGNEVGMEWVTVPGEPQRVWIGENCARDARAGVI